MFIFRLFLKIFLTKAYSYWAKFSLSIFLKAILTWIIALYNKFVKIPFRRLVLAIVLQNRRIVKFCTQKASLMTTLACVYSVEGAKVMTEADDEFAYLQVMDWNWSLFYYYYIYFKLAPRFTIFLTILSISVFYMVAWICFNGGYIFMTIGNSGFSWVSETAPQLSFWDAGIFALLFMAIQTEILGHLNPFVVFLWSLYEFAASWIQNFALFRETVITLATNKPRLPPKKPRIDYYKDNYTRSLFFFRFSPPDDENEVFQDDMPAKCFICSEILFFFAAYFYVLFFIESKPQTFKNIVTNSTANQISLDTYSLTRVALDDLDNLVPNRSSEFTTVPEQRFAKRVYGTTRSTKSFKVFAELQKSRIDSFNALEHARLMERKSS